MDSLYPFIIIPSVIAFLLAIGCAKELVSQESKVTRNVLFSVINLSLLLFVLALYVTLGYQTGGPERGMVFVLVIAGVPIIFVENILAMFFAARMLSAPAPSIQVDTSVNDLAVTEPNTWYEKIATSIAMSASSFKTRNAKSEIDSIPVKRSWLYNHPVTMLTVVLIFVSMAAVPVIVNNVHKKNKASADQYLKEKNDKEAAYTLWWQNHVASPTNKTVDELTPWDFVISKEELPPGYDFEWSSSPSAEYPDYHISDLVYFLKRFGISPTMIEKSVGASYHDFRREQFEFVMVGVVKYDNFENLKRDVLAIDRQNKKSNPTQQVTITIVSNFLILVRKDVNYFTNPNYSITGLIREKFPQYQTTESFGDRSQSVTATSSNQKAP